MLNLKSLAVLALAVVATAHSNGICSEPIPGVPERYWFLYEPNWPLRDEDIEAARKGLPFETLSLERVAGLAIKPNSYTVTLHRDGTATFNGANARLQGQFDGQVLLHDYGHLCFLIERIQLEKLPVDIRRRKVHGSHATAAIVRADKTKRGQIVSHEINNCGPIELWTLQMAMDAVASKIEWMAK